MKVCNGVGCAELLERGGYCDACRPKRRAGYRSPESQRRQRAYKTEKWKQFSKRFLAANPICVGCGAPSEHTDHIAGHGPDGPGGFDPTACQPLCRSCHSRKTVHADSGFGRPRLER